VIDGLSWRHRISSPSLGKGANAGITHSVPTEYRRRADERR